MKTKKVYALILALVLILSGCKPHQSFYVVKLTTGTVRTCKIIEWRDDNLYCDGGLLAHYSNVAKVEFKAAR